MDEPQQLKQRVVGFGNEDRCSLELLGAGELPAHGEFARKWPDTLRTIVYVASQPGQVKCDQEEEAPAERVGGVLLRLHDVRAALVEEAGNRGDDSRAVGTRDQQTPDVPVFFAARALGGQAVKAPPGRADTGSHNSHCATSNRPDQQPPATSLITELCDRPQTSASAPIRDIGDGKRYGRTGE